MLTNSRNSLTSHNLLKTFGLHYYKFLFTFDNSFNRRTLRYLQAGPTKVVKKIYFLNN